MDITFLVGNGFDLSLGYKTSYKDFYEYYLQQPNDPVYDEAISRLKRCIEEDRKKGLEKWSDFEKGLGEFTVDFGLDEVNAFVDAYTDAVRSLHDYLSNLPKNFNILTMLAKGCDKDRKGICYFYQEAHEQDIAFFSRLKTDEQINGRETVFRFISFNYTSFLDDYLEIIAKEPLEIWKRGSEEKKHILDPKVFHVHGTLNDYPIVGVSSVEQIANQDIRKSDLLCQTLIKSNSIAEIGSPRYTQAEAIINKSRIVCLWGLSLGDSDKRWWEFVNKWLKDNQDRHLFIFQHTNTPPSNILVADLYRKKREVTNRLLCFSSFSEGEKQLLEKRIHVIFNTKQVLAFPQFFKLANLH